MLADTSDIHAFSAAQRRHAEDLSSVATRLAAAQVAPDAYGSVGCGFLAALNAALATEAHHAVMLADRLVAARSAAAVAADSYRATEASVGQSISSPAV